MSAYSSIVLASMRRDEAIGMEIGRPELSSIENILLLSVY